MNKKLTLVFSIWAVLLLFFTAPTLAQSQGWCGTSDFEAITQRLLKNKQALKDGTVITRNAITYVPLTFHLISESDGSGQVSVRKVLEQMTALNRDFADTDLQFYLNTVFSELSNSTIYQAQSSFLAQNQMETIRDDNGIDVFLVKTVSGNANQPGTALGVYSPFRDWIIIANRDVNAISGTLSHEVGHFFSLNHTHYGWDSKAWDHDNPTPNPVGNTSPEGIPTELQDGSNCQTSGDFICDTPPDYNFGLGWRKDGDTCAPYDAGVKDPKGTVVDPMESNHMGYFISCDDYDFTTEQITVMKADYNSSGRRYLRNGYVPNLNEITEIPVLKDPINDKVTPGYNLVDLIWEGVPEAEYYLVQVDRLPDFSFDLQEFVTEGTSITIQDLTPDRFYFWRVFAFSQYDTDGLPANFGRFKTGKDMVSATNYIEGVNDWYISPNPLETSQSLRLYMNSERNFEADIKIFNLAGQQLSAVEGHYFNSGRSVLNLEAADLARGMYIVSIQTEDAIINRKLVVN